MNYRNRLRLAASAAVACTALLVTSCAGEPQAAPTVTVTATVTVSATATVTAQPVEPETWRVTDMDGLVKAWEKAAGRECTRETPENPFMFAEDAVACDEVNVLTTYKRDSRRELHMESEEADLVEAGKRELWVYGELWTVRQDQDSNGVDNELLIETIGGDVTALG